VLSQCTWTHEGWHRSQGTEQRGDVQEAGGVGDDSRQPKGELSQKTDWVTRSTQNRKDPNQPQLQRRKGRAVTHVARQVLQLLCVPSQGQELPHCPYSQVDKSEFPFLATKSSHLPEAK
jgi:hypothetical protein